MQGYRLQGIHERQGDPKKKLPIYDNLYDIIRYSPGGNRSFSFLDLLHSVSGSGLFY